MTTNKEPGEVNFKSQQQLLDMYQNNVNVGDNKDEDNKTFEEEEEYSMVEKFEMEESEKSLNTEKEESDIEVLPSMVAYQNENSKSSENVDEVENGSIQNDVDNIVQVSKEDQHYLDIKEDEDVKNKQENYFGENEPENGELRGLKKRMSEMEHDQEKRRKKEIYFKTATLVCIVVISVAIFHLIMSQKPGNHKELTTQVDKLMIEFKKCKQDIEHLENSLAFEIDKHEKILHETQLKIERQNMFLDQVNAMQEEDPNARHDNKEKQINNQKAAQTLQIALLELDEQFQNHKENLKTEIETAIELEMKKYASKYDEQNSEKVSQKFQTALKEFNKIIETREIKLEEKIEKAIEEEINPIVNKITREPNLNGRESKEKEINEQITKRLIGFGKQIGIAIFAAFLFAMASFNRIIENKFKTEISTIEKKVSKNENDIETQSLEVNDKIKTDVSIIEKKVTKNENDIETHSLEVSDQFLILHKKMWQLHQALFSTLPVQLQLSSSKLDGPSGFYSLTSGQENGFPVYKKVTGDAALFLSVDTQGFWGVKTELGSSYFIAKNQENNPTPIIPPESGWTCCENIEESTSLILTHVPGQLSIEELSESEQEVDMKLKVTPVPVQLLISSTGSSQTTRSNLMGIYRLVNEQVNNHPVYKRIAGLESDETSGNMVEAFLYMSNMSGSMKWSVGYEVGSATYLRSVQDGICPPTTDWEYSDGKWIKDPCLTVKVPASIETEDSIVAQLDTCITEDMDEKIESGDIDMEEELDQME